jgi:peptide/nickel transport system permease protein
MSRYIVVRLVQGVVALFLGTVVIFLLARLTGNPLYVMLPLTATPADFEEMARHLGLDQPLPVQYWIYIRQAAKGDLGRSIFFQKSVVEMIVERVPATIKLAGASALLSVLIALPLGVVAAVKRNGWQDLTAKVIAFLGQSVAMFWLGIVLIQVFGVRLGWLPCGGYGGIQYYILPSITLGWYVTAGIVRLTRSAMLDVLDADYVRTARIKGVSEGLVIWKHALRNALIPVVTFSAIIYVQFLMGSVIVETVFAWPGVGRLAYEAVIRRDFPLIQGIVIVFVGLYIVLNLAIDILYVYLDPRIRYVKQ